MGQRNKRGKWPSWATWLVTTMLVVAAAVAGTLFGLTYWKARRELGLKGTSSRITTLVHTGPQREVLKGDLLAELLGLSVDHPRDMVTFDCAAACRQLLAWPLIRDAEVKKFSPEALYVDYALRQPIAWLADVENAAIDAEGVIVPVSPFLTPKNLTKVFFGIKKAPQWGDRIFELSASGGQLWEAAVAVLHILQQPEYQRLLRPVLLDVSHLAASQYGRREIVVTFEDSILLPSKNKQILKRVVRLSPANYSKALANYLALRETILQEEYQNLRCGRVQDEGRSPVTVIDLRLVDAAFVEK